MKNAKCKMQNAKMQKQISKSIRRLADQNPKSTLNSGTPASGPRYLARQMARPPAGSMDPAGLADCTSR
ncbi:MAG: hypothetical protein IPH84_06875 [Bacteroidales bacterium]|nr:hypothetical protein [Bacteroidales bacterium]